MDMVTLGRTGITVNKNGFGALPIQRISQEDAVFLARKAYKAGIRFFDTAEISCTAQPTGGIERGINCKFGKMFLDAGSYRISFVLGLTGIIPCINLYAVTRTFNHFLLIRTGRNILRTYQCRNACILMDSHLALSRHITFQAFHNIILRYRNRCKSETCNQK